MKIVSKAQAGFLARIGFGKGKPGKNGPTPAKARTMMRENKGMKVSALPARAPQRAAKRSNYRGGGR